MRKALVGCKIAMCCFVTFSLVSLLFAEDQGDEEFPWELFYPAIIQKSVDNDKDGFTVKQGDCDDSDAGVYPNAVELCGDGIDQDCNGSDLPCPPCLDIAGDWYASETVNITCCLGGDCESDTISGSGTITMQQNGCNISYDLYVSGYGTFTRTGTIDSNQIQLSGIFAVLQPWCTATENNVDITGTVNGDRIDLQGSGVINGTCDGARFSCTGGSTATLTRRNSSASTSRFSGQESDSIYSPTFFDERIRIISIIDH